MFSLHFKSIKYAVTLTLFLHIRRRSIWHLEFSIVFTGMVVYVFVRSLCLFIFLTHGMHCFIVDAVYFVVVTVDATHRPVELFHLHAEIADYFHHGRQRFQNFGLQPTKWVKLSVSL